MTSYYTLHGRFQEAFDYLDGQLSVTPFNESARLHALRFQLALQLCQAEKRPAIKERAFKRVGSAFQDYLGAEGNDPQVCMLFYETVRSVGSDPEELRSCLETLVDLCPDNLPLRQAYIDLLGESFPSEAQLLYEQKALYEYRCSALGIPF